MSQKYKDYFDPEKQRILDKYIGNRRYGIFNPLIHDVFQRRQYEFDIPVGQFVKEVKNFRKNVRIIHILTPDTAKGFFDGFSAIYSPTISAMLFNAGEIANTHDQSLIKRFYAMFAHEMTHAITDRGKEIGISQKRGKNFSGVGLNEIITEMAASRVARNITGEELEVGRQETTGYQKLMPFGNFLISAFGVSEKSFLKAGMRSRDALVNLLSQKFQSVPKEAVSMSLSKYETNLDILSNSLRMPREQALTGVALTELFNSGYDIASTQIQLDTRKLTPEYISEINYRYNQMRQIQEKSLKGYNLTISEHVSQNLEAPNSSKNFLRDMVADLNKVYLLQGIIRDRRTIDLLTQYAREGLLMEKRSTYFNETRNKFK